MYDYRPYSKGRMLRILEIYEAAYQWRKRKLKDRTREHIYMIQGECEFDASEIIFFLDLINNYTVKSLRRYLLDNDSKIVRRGKKTYIRKKKK